MTSLRLKTWKLILDLEANRATSKTLGVYFDLCFEHAAKGLPQDVIFNSINFVRPPRPNPTGFALLMQCAEALSDKQIEPIQNSSVMINVFHGNDSLCRLPDFHQVNHQKNTDD